MTELRKLTDAGILEARRRLDLLRQGKMQVSAVTDLFRNRKWCGIFDDGVSISPQDFRTRRGAAEYLSSTLGHLRGRIQGHRGVWSFLGMYFLENTTQTGEGQRVSPLDACYLLDVGGRTTQKRYRHYLWGALRLHERHGNDASFLLDQPLGSWTNMAERAFGSLRIFNSRGVVPLMQRLYVEDGKQRRGADRGRGGFRHLIRVLNQLERTHDVYGEMTPEAILEVLPDAFRAWDEK